MKIDTKLLEEALASAEELTEMVDDDAGIGSSTLRIVVGCIAGVIERDHPRFNTGAFEHKALPKQAERRKQAILATLGKS